MTKKKKKLLLDGISNMGTGLGSASDAKTLSDFEEITLTEKDMVTAYRFDWLFPKAVEIPAKDMTKKWLMFEGKKKSIELIKNNYKRLKVKQLVRKALVYKALYGVSYLVVESEGRRLSSRLNLTDKVRQLHVYHKYSFAAKDSDIHESRIFSLEHNEFQDSLLYRVKESIINLLTSLGIPASLMHKADFDFLSIKGLADALRKCKKNKDCKDAEEKILKRVQTMYEQLSLFRIGIKDTDEEYESHTKDLSGYDKLQQIYMKIVAGAADIPESRFYNTAPSGLNATGQSELTNYHESLSAAQDEHVEPFLEKLNENILISNQKNLNSFSWSFAPIRDIDPKELAEIEDIKASTIVKFIDELDPETIAQAASRLKVFEGINIGLNNGEEA